MIEITASEYYLEIESIRSHQDLMPKEKNKRLKALFERLCKQVTSEESMQFSNLFSRLSWISEHRLESHPVLVKRLQQLRYRFHELSHATQVQPELTQQELLPLVEAIAFLLEGEIPQEWLLVSPGSQEVRSRDYAGRNIMRMRARFLRKEGDLLLVEVDDEEITEPIKVYVRSEHDGRCLFEETIDSLHEGAQLNLLQVYYDKGSDWWVADLLVLEPDFLLDISTLAECFKDYGHHPLNYFMAKLTPDQNTHHMLLGNIANQFLDDIVNQTEQEPADYYVSMQKAFRLSPISLATCEALEDEQTQKQFFEATKEQFWHIQRVVEEQFAQQGFDRKNILLEPAFVCEALGVQGRLDLLQADCSRFIELKSGKAQELYPSKEITHKENHYVQMMLYYAVLQFNMGVKYDQIDAYLLYSKYPRLYHMAPYWGLLKQSINLRNQIVALEYRIQQHNDPHYSRAILQTINSETLNTKSMQSNFWNRYLRPTIDEFAYQMSAMSDLESDYFFSLFNFIIKEQYTAKAGDVDAEFKRGVTALWDASLDEKMDAGEIIKDLVIEEIAVEEGKHKIRFQMPTTDVLTLPNYRQGDAVMLYLRDGDAAQVTNRQVFKATIESIDAFSLVLSLRVIQRNETVLPLTAQYAIERDYIDSSFAAMLKGLALFLQATSQRKSLLLGERVPRVNRTHVAAFDPNEDDFSRVVRKAVEAEDFFLLVGPPGTGKTSCALKQMVDTFYADKHKNILLLAYTNKAVDEICGSISAEGSAIPFVRIGQEATCEAQYRDTLLQNRIRNCKRRVEVRDEIDRFRVFVGTVSSLSRQSELFKIKRFDVAIIDEASQILEPQLLGLLTATDATGSRDAIAKFIMIGDHKQLPAVVVQPSEASEVQLDSLKERGMLNLNESLFQRLYRAELLAGRSEFVDMLSRQGRMHPAISEFVSKHFYHNELFPVPLPHQLEEDSACEVDMKDLNQVILHKRFAFIAIEKREKHSPNKVNPQEAMLVAHMVKVWYDHYVLQDASLDLAREVGVITPYRSQIAMIRKELQRLGLPHADQIVIDTVERFQGGQRNLMIYSCCMNAPYQMNFLSNTIEERGVMIDRKLNVALTRARKQMFVVGNPAVLRRDPIYNRLLDYLWSTQSWYTGETPTL